MPSILSRFKKSPSSSSSLGDSDDRPSYHSDRSGPSEEDSTNTISSSPTSNTGSIFVEQLGDNSNLTPHSINNSLSPDRRGSVISAGTVTPTNQKPSIPLSVPDSTQANKIGTPRLVLTEEGSDSPRSFSSSPSKGNDERVVGLGLGTDSPTMYRPIPAVSPQKGFQPPIESLTDKKPI